MFPGSFSRGFSGVGSALLRDLPDRGSTWGLPCQAGSSVTAHHLGSLSRMRGAQADSMTDVSSNRRAFILRSSAYLPEEVGQVGVGIQVPGPAVLSGLE